MSVPTMLISTTASQYTAGNVATQPELRDEHGGEQHRHDEDRDVASETQIAVR